MRFIHFLIFFFIVSMDVFNGIFCETVAGPEREYELNDSSAEGETFEVDRQPSNVGPPDSHEAMNNRDLGQQHREKRSFEFLVGLINNNSKYEVIRSDPEMNADRGALRKTENTSNSDGTQLLLDLLAKIVAYPDHWRRIHQVLRSLDHDLSSFQHILRHHQQLKSQYSEPKTLELKRKFQNEQISKMSSTSTPKWPVFDDPIEETSKIPTKSEEKTSYQKNFAYHKVTGKPAHLKKYPSAYIAVSAISPRPAQSEENFLLESELHRLKPWKNKYERKE